MERITVKSSNIQTIGYDREKRVLEVEFKNGGIYQYHDVESGKFRILMAAESKGAFLHSQIKPHYKCEKVGQKEKGAGK